MSRTGKRIELLDHGRNAWRDRGKPRSYRTNDVCKKKRYFLDEVTTRAMGQVSIVEEANVEKLWPYKCRHCPGWHLTHHPQRGVVPITEARALAGVDGSSEEREAFMARWHGKARTR